MRKSIAITLAGTVTVRTGENTASELGQGPRGRVAFAFLVLERHRPVARDELAEVIWGEGLPATWRSALRLLLSRLRAALAEVGLGGPEILTSVGGCYQLRLSEHVEVDVESVAHDVETGAAALVAGDPVRAQEAAVRAVSVARGRFLPSDCGPWVERRQAELGHLLLDALDLGSRAASAVGDHRAAVAWAREAARLEPWDEARHLRVVGAHVGGGDPVAARRAYDDCRRALAAELGVTPSAEADAAYARLMADHLGGGPPGNLRLPVSSFVGRAEDLAALADLCRAHRVLSLVGPGGVGKSRLAVELATRLAADYPDGAWVVELAGVARHAAITPHVLAVLGVPDVLGETPEEALVRHLVDRRALLVFDNCEHVLVSCAALVAELAGRCRRLDVLATSRAPLGLTGEAIWTVQPLSVPGPGHIGPLSELLSFDAVRLFVDRALAVAPTLAVDDVSAEVARICRQLDGLPLAIELTAARARSFALPEIEDRLGDRFRFLVSGGRRTLEATIDWSYGTLGPTERRLFALVALFVGGFGLDSAKALCPIPEDELVDALAGLVEKSVVVADQRPGTVRYRMLETMRQYGVEKLAAAGKGAEAAGRDRHLAWACALAEAVEPGLEGPDQAGGLAVLDTEEDNLRAALDWAEQSGDHVLGARLAVALWRFWEISGRLREGRARLEVLAERACTPAPLRARAFNGAGILAQRQSDWPAAQRLYTAALDLHRELGNRRGVAGALNGLANLAVSGGELDRAELLFTENLVIGRGLDDDRLVASSLLNLAVVHQCLAATGGVDGSDALARARSHCEESLLLYRVLGDRHSQAMALESLGSLTALQGDVTGSRRLLAESLALSRSLGDRVGMAASSRFLGQLASREGRHAAARTLHEQSLSLERQLGNDVLEATDLLSLGEIAAAQAAFDEARGYFQRSLVIYRGLGDDAGSERALLALADIGDRTG